MYRYPDDTIHARLPRFVQIGDQLRPVTQLDAATLAEAGYYEAVPVTREPHTNYETSWSLDGLIYRESIISQTVDQAAIDAARRAAIVAELAALDMATVRPLRAVLAAQAAGDTPAVADTDRLGELEAQAQTLRTELAGLVAA